MLKLLLPAILLFSFNSMAVEIVTQAKPYRASATERVPFFKGKKFSIGFIRVYADSRPMIGLTPVENHVDLEFEPEFYSCLRQQVEVMKKAVTENATVKKNMLPVAILAVRQIELPFIESLCKPSVITGGDNILMLNLCYADKSSLSSAGFCKTVESTDFISYVSQLQSNTDKRIQEFNSLKNVSKELYDILNN